jgi:polygalacturonase
MSERKLNPAKFLNIIFMLLTGFLFSISCYAKSKPLVFNVLDYKAKGDGVTLNTKSIQAAIDHCSESGGGTVYFPSGKFISGTIFLKSHVTLYLDAGAVLEGSRNIKDYPEIISKVRSYTDNYTNKSLIYGEELENIAITGHGTIDGNGADFIVSDELIKNDLSASYKARPFMIRVINCKDILIRDVTMLNSPMWVQHYLLCYDLNIDGITVDSRVNHNNDGIDIDGCSKVRISNCIIGSGDDAIVLKSTLDTPCKDITVTNCVLSSDCNAFKLGTETNGGFQNITLTNCTIYDTRLAGITLQMVDGGILDRVSVSNVTMNNVGTAIFMRLGNRARPYNDSQPKPGMGSLSHVIIDNIQGTSIGKTGCSITGLDGYMVEDVTLSNICLTFEGGGTGELSGLEMPEIPAAYPEHNMFGTLPAYGFYCRHVKNIEFNNIDLECAKPEARPAFVFEDAINLNLIGVEAITDINAPVIQFSSVKNAIIQSCKAYKGTGTFLQLKGLENLHLTMTGNDLGYAEIPVSGDNRSSVFTEANRMPPLYGKSDGNYVNCGLQYTDDREIRIHSPSEVKTIRMQIIKAIWGSDKLPDRSDVTVTSDIKSPLEPNAFLSRVDRYEIPVNAPLAEGADPVNDLAYLFVPVNRINRLVILNPGHLCTLKESPETNYGIEAAINGLLHAGFDVLAVFMPHVSETDCNLDHCSVMNKVLSAGNHPATYGLRFFLEPEIVCLNYLLSKINYKDINMVGLSGGGWTANLLAAIDDRIKFSFSVAGSMPLYYRSDLSMGDIEQFIPELYRNIAGYPDLYILGAYGKGRKQIQVLNRNDNCCFGQKQHDPQRSYDKDLRLFEGSVKDKLKELDSAGHYYLVIDETAPGHQISKETLNNVILKELNSK